MFCDMLHKDEFSVRNGIGNTEDIIPLLKERNQTHFALANYGEVSNWVNQYFNCIKNNIIPILGIETHVNNHKVSGEGKDIVVENIFENWKKNVSEMNEDEKSLVQIDFNLALFASNMDGYYNIIKIHNDAQINGFTDKPKTNDVFLKEHGKGVIAVMPTPFSEVSTLIFNGNWKEAKNKLEFYSSVFDEVYMAITLVEEKEYSEFNDSVIKFCEKFNVKMIPVLNSHYIYPKDESLLDTMNKMQKIKSGVKFEVDLLSKMYYRSYDEVYELWKNVFEDDIFTENVFAKMNFNLTKLLSKFEVLPLDTSPKTPHFENCEQILREKCIEGLKARGLEGNQEYLERMEYELDNIVKAGFADYFVLLEDLCTWCWNNGVHTGTGRGCFLPNSRVLMSDGFYKYIQDVKIGDKVFSGEGNIRDVNDVYCYEVDEEVVELELNDGRIIKCTLDHEIKIMRNGNELWEKAINITEHDEIVELSKKEFNKTVKMKSKKVYKYTGKVYDINVDKDHNYTIENCVVHNSAAGSLVLYLLNITHADPIKYNLLFERFLSADKLQEIIEKGGKVTGCFSEDTIVRLENDYKYISEINEGDIVIGSDNKSHKVIRTIYKGVQDTIRVVYELDDKLYYFDCTKGHRVSIIENRVVKDKMICEVSIGDYFYRPDGTKAKIIEKNFYKNQKVYDLEVEDNHHYCVCGKELIANKLNNDKLFDNKKIIKINGDFNNGIQRQYYRFD